MSLKNINRTKAHEKYLINNLNDFIIKIDYYDQKGIKKYNNKIPLKYILSSKTTNSQATI